MKIYSGIQNGAVLQRDENNLCKIRMRADFTGMPTSNFGFFEKIGEHIWEFKGVFVGGPYEITISDDDSSVTYSDVYVGDVWLLAGQSNMEGGGYPTYEDKICEVSSKPYLRALYMEEEWRPVQPRMSNLSKSTDAVHQVAHNDWIASINKQKKIIRDAPPYESQRSVGPGLWFAEEMFKLTDGIPQGLILTAVGGSSVDMWLPDSKKANYFDAAARRIELLGNNIKGILWAQGEVESKWEEYPQKIEIIRKCLCNQLGVKEIPLVLTQNPRSTLDISYAAEAFRSAFRAMQWEIQCTQSLTETIATNDLELCDRLHLSSDSQKKCGIRMANAMYHLITGIGYPQPTIESIELERAFYFPDSSTTVKIKYKNTCGNLRANGVPFGFTLRKIGSTDKPTIQNMSGISLKKNVVVLNLDGINIEDAEEYEIFYGFGHDFYCNITDSDDRAIPAMGPIRIKDYL